MKQVILCLLLIMGSGCQSSIYYWYHPQRSLQQAEWDLIHYAEYTAYGCPAYRQEKGGYGRQITVLESNLRGLGYQRVSISSLPPDAVRERIWLYLRPCNIAGIDDSTPRWPKNP